jgi:hypothetical protein
VAVFLCRSGTVDEVRREAEGVGLQYRSEPRSRAGGSRCCGRLSEPHPQARQVLAPIRPVVGRGLRRARESPLL